jgi:hypothetical protein
MRKIWTVRHKTMDMGEGRQDNNKTLGSSFNGKVGHRAEWRLTTQCDKGAVDKNSKTM